MFNIFKQYITYSLLLNRRNHNQFLLTFQKSSNVDVIDSYINELINRKTIKWEEIKQSQKQNELKSSNESSHTNLLKGIQSLYKPKLLIDASNFNQNHIDSLFLSSIENKNIDDVKNIIDQCLIHNKIPTDTVFLKVIDFLSSAGDNVYVDKIIKLCYNMNQYLYNIHTGFSFNLGQCYWITGNVNLGLKHLEKAYIATGEQFKEKVRNALKQIVSDTIQHKSEAVLYSVIELIERLSKDHNDVNLLCTTWKYCFKSSWFSDQNIAITLFEKYDQLRGKIGNESNIFCYNLLTEHSVETVHRLLELYLKYKMSYECQNLLNLLFEYHYWRKDTRACTEIVRNSIDLSLELTPVCHQKFLHLLLRKPIVIRKNSFKTPKFKLQF